MRVPLHEHFHVSVTSCQRAEVKRVLHCDAATSADMNALLSKNSLLPVYFHPNNYKFLFCRSIKVDQASIQYDLAFSICQISELQVDLF